MATQPRRWRRARRSPRSSASRARAAPSTSRATSSTRRSRPARHGRAIELARPPGARVALACRIPSWSSATPRHPASSSSREASTSFRRTRRRRMMLHRDDDRRDGRSARLSGRVSWPRSPSGRPGRARRPGTKGRGSAPSRSGLWTTRPGPVTFSQPACLHGLTHGLSPSRYAGRARCLGRRRGHLSPGRPPAGSLRALAAKTGLAGAFCAGPLSPAGLDPSPVLLGRAGRPGEVGEAHEGRARPSARGLPIWPSSLVGSSRPASSRRMAALVGDLDRAGRCSGEAVEELLDRRRRPAPGARPPTSGRFGAEHGEHDAPDLGGADEALQAEGYLDDRARAARPAARRSTTSGRRSGSRSASPG